MNPLGIYENVAFFLGGGRVASSPAENKRVVVCLF